MVREVGLEMRCEGAQRCEHMKPPHELDERVVVAESVVPVLWGDVIRNVLVGLLLGRLGKTILGRVGRGVEEPEVPRQLSHVAANGDDPLPMPRCLVLNSKGDEIGKVPQGWWEN
ncbi:hypothetical protein GOBAR_AA11690 [Gossypium barbadense]|uniref:Uncharacterized protein n=1 Tax=Gossypium barbadense TaxID=3634 RepID=A0A2P5Y035_GOSBA|nr:hypothetical protein GOBAR_AA11690 [Gossypium barbadense]